MTKLDIVLPGLNEEKGLEAAVVRLRDFMSERMGEYDRRITIADNGSADATPRIGRALSAEYEDVFYTRLERRGRGRALKRAWSESGADIVGYMDMDLSTDLNALPALISAVERDGYEVAIGSRLKRGAKVIGRSPKRELTSRSYSLMFRAAFFTGFRDAQCGFKAVSRRVVEDVLPLVEDTGWFFDSELLILCEKSGYPIFELPVRWEDDPDSKVRVVGTAYRQILGLARLRFGGLRRAKAAIRDRRAIRNLREGGR